MSPDSEIRATALPRNLLKAVAVGGVGEIVEAECWWSRWGVRDGEEQADDDLRWRPPRPPRPASGFVAQFGAEAGSGGVSERHGDLSRGL